MGYSPQVSVVLSAQEEGKCQSWTMGHRWGNSSPNPGCRQRQLSHDVCEKSQGACCDGLSSPGNGAAPGGQGWKHRGSSCSLAGTEPRYWRCPVLTPLSWAAPGGVGCCGSPTGAVNSRLAGWLPLTAVGCHKCCKKRRCWGDGDKPHIWAGCVVWPWWQPMGCSQPPGSTVGLQWVQLAAGTAVSSPSSCHGDPSTPGAADRHRVVTLEAVKDLPQDELCGQVALSPVTARQNQSE